MKDFAAIDFETGKLLIEKSRKQQKVLIEKSNFTERLQGKYCNMQILHKFSQYVEISDKFKGQPVQKMHMFHFETYE